MEEKLQVARLKLRPSKRQGVGQTAGVTLDHTNGENNHWSGNALDDFRNQVLQIIAFRIVEVHPLHIAVGVTVAAVPLVNLLAPKRRLSLAMNKASKT